MTKPDAARIDRIAITLDEVRSSTTKIVTRAEPESPTAQTSTAKVAEGVQKEKKANEEKRSKKPAEWKSSLRITLAIAVILGILIMGYWVFTYSGMNSTISLNSSPLSTPINNSIGMEFVLMPAGEFDMGSPSSEAGRYDNEGPVHHVKIGNAFYMGKYEVTQKQWRDVMGSNPSYFKGDNLPVEQVSWNDVQTFIIKLSEKEGTDRYRLPTESEWEYAARANTTTKYSFGDDDLKLWGYAWYNVNSDGKTHEVGQKKPNPWGLYDMHGNVWEWVQDNWHGDYNGAPTNGSSWESGSIRVGRGGSWYGYARDCRSAYRFPDDPGDRDDYLGFRLLRIL